MKTFKLLFIFFLLFGFSQSWAQISYTAQANRLQLFPRSADDSATVALNGNVTNSQWNKIIFTYHKDAVLIDSGIVDLNFTNNNAPFNRSYRIKASKNLNHFRIYLRNNSTTVKVLSADSVVCGDVFLISGQSNAASNPLTGGVDLPYLWVRTYGNPTINVATAVADTNWAIGQGNSYSNTYSIGVWGLRLGKMLVDSLNIPVCIINGARPGTTINEHLPLANPASTSSLFGRMLYRATKAKITNSVRAIFWWQGENDGTATDAPQYGTRLSQLRNAWLTHYPTTERIFVIQTRMGCIDGSPEHQLVREAHRKASHLYPETRTISTMLVAGFDGCHFNTQGYQTIAAQIQKCVTKELYAKSHPATIYPPDVVNATFTNSTNTELSIVFDQPVAWPAIFNGNNLKDYFYLNAPVTVLSGSASNDTVKLTLSSTSNAYKLSYMPNQYYNGTTTNYAGPWLTSSTGLGALSFYSFPVNSGLEISASVNSLCVTGNTILTANKTGQSFQWYYEDAILPGATANQFTAAKSGQYYVKMTDGNGVTVTSNILVISVGSAIVPEVTSNTGMFEFCTGGSIVLSSSTPAVSYTWSTGQTGPSINVSQEGTYSVTITDAMGCSATSLPVNVIQHIPQQPTILAESNAFCAGDSILLTSSGINNVLWSNGSTSLSIYVTTPGNYTVTVSDYLGCLAVSNPFNLLISSPPTPVINAPSTGFCEGDSLNISASYGNSFLWSTGQTISAIYINTPGTFTLTVTDSIGCSSSPGFFTASMFTKPIAVITGSGTQVCSGQSILLTSSPGVSYSWSSGQTSSSISANQTGSYFVTVTNANGCKNTSAAYDIFVGGPPVTVSPAGNVNLCSGLKQWLTATSPGATTYAWYRNNGKISNATASTYQATSAGTYYVRVTNSAGCTANSPSTVITVVPTPTSSFTVANEADNCNDSVVTLTANAGAGFTYQWLKNNIAISGATSQVYVTNAKGSYSVIVSSSYGCSRYSSGRAIPIVSVTASFVANGSKTICSGDSVQLVANSGTGFVYQWQRNSVNIAGATAIMYYAKTAGNYRVRVTNPMGCSATSANQAVTVVSCGRNESPASTVSGNTNFYIYPNPSGNIFNIIADDGFNGTVKYEIYDIIGKQRNASTIDFNNEVNQVGYDLQPGIYILKLEADGIRKTYRIEKTSN